MRGPSSLRGAMDASADGSTLRLTSGSQESRVMGLSSTEARIIYWRNMIVLMLSLIVGTKTICAILSGWQHTRYSPVRKFTNTLMVILLGLEVINTVLWLIGVNIAGSVDGAAPWTKMSAERGDRMCLPVAVVNFWLDPMLYFWHAIMAYFIWAWVVRNRDVGALQRQIPWSFALAATISACVTAIPVHNHNLGLWPHSDCFVRESWLGPRKPAMGVLLDRMILMPISWVVILIFNMWTIIHLREETGHFMTLTSVKRLQLRLLLITAAFIVIWVLMSIPLYANKRTFALEICVKWAFAIGFVDAMIYGYLGTVQCLRPCLRSMPLSFRFWTPESRQQQPEQGSARPRRPTSFWETFMPDNGGPTRSHGESGSSGGARSQYWYPGRLPRRTSTELGRGSGASLLSFRPRSHGKPSPLEPYHIFATTFDTNFRCLPLQGDRQDCGEGTGGVCAAPTSSATTCELDPVLQRGLEAWIPARTTGGAQYHLYVIAVQRCRVVGRLRQIIHAHLGGSAHYVVAGSAEIGDALTGRTAIMLFARTVDVESGALRIVASNQRPVVLWNGVRGGVKGVLGMAFSYYDTTMAVVNAHLPATSVYASASASVNSLEEREKHIGGMLHDLEIGAGHPLWDSHLQYHHVILLGNLNYGMRLPPAEMIERVQQASIACQTGFEEERELLRGSAGLEWNWRRGAGYNRFWAVCDPELQQDSPGSVPFMHGRHSSMRGQGSDAGGWGIGLADISEMGEHQGRHPHDRSCEDRIIPHPLEAWWAWVKAKDVLCQRMAKGGLLHGFCEAPISFPPSFKFRVGASAGDYTERQVLEAAYVIGPRRANAYPQWSPSYTDRILVHSLDDIKHRCILGAYDMCDEGPLALISDHRPLSLALAVMIDTTQLPSIDSLGRGSRRHARTTSDTANAMAFAATQRQRDRHRRPQSFSPIEQLLSLQQQPFAGQRSFPLLVRVAFSCFRFNFRGFDVLCDRSARGAGTEEVKEAGAQAGEGKGGEVAGPPRELLQRSASCAVVEHGKEPPRAKSWLRLPSLIRESASSARQAAAEAAASRHVAEEGPSIIDHVLILYPLPCEDPLAPIRRAQLFGESLQALPRTDILEPSHRSSRVEEGRGSQRGPAARPPSPTGMLQNFYRVHWRPGFEAPDSSHGGSSDLAYPSVSTIHQECKQPGRAAITEESILIDVLTLGPPRSMQHVLMKFMGKRGKELGQAVFCIGELLTGSGGLSTSSRSSSLSGRWPPAPGAPSRGASSAGVAATKHTVDLTTGGRFKGTVSFELAVKTKRRAQGEGDALQRTMEEARSAGRGSGSG